MRKIEEIKADVALVNESTGSGRYERLKDLNNELLQAITQGIDLDHLQEICQAECEDRCVVLPFKIGNFVYWAYSDDEIAFRGKVELVHITVGMSLKHRIGFEVCEESTQNIHYLSCDQIFRTQEEAKKALEGLK